MLSKLFIAWCLMALCVTIHAIGLTAALRWMKRRSATIEGRFWPAAWMLICIAGWTILMHLLQIAVWAFFYAWKHGMPDLPSAFYFSAVTYTIRAVVTSCCRSSGVWLAASKRSRAS